MALTKEQFIEKYGFPKPYDASDRDMVIISNLSDIKIKMSHDLEGAMKTLDELKHFMWDTKDV